MVIVGVIKAIRVVVWVRFCIGGEFRIRSSRVVGTVGGSLSVVGGGVRRMGLGWCWGCDGGGLCGHVTHCTLWAGTVVVVREVCLCCRCLCCHIKV